MLTGGLPLNALVVNAKSGIPGTGCDYYLATYLDGNRARRLTEVPPGLESRWDGKKLYRLGKALAEAYRTWAAMIEPSDGDIQTIAQLLDRYALEVVPFKAPKTQASNQAAIKRLRAVFGGMRVSDLTPQHAYRYRDKRGQNAPTAARFMARVLDETRVTERFTEHDLHAKAGSDAESLDHTRALLAHASDSTTKRIYRRKAERVKPSKGV